jgi:hypothetical protein
LLVKVDKVTITQTACTSAQAIRERGPQRSILVERSGPAATCVPELTGATKPLAQTLWERMVRVTPRADTSAASAPHDR